MSKFFSIGNTIINKDNVINISTKLIKHGKKDLVDDNGNPYSDTEQYAIVIKQIEDQTSTLYYDTKEERDNALSTLVQVLVFDKEVVKGVIQQTTNDSNLLSQSI